MVDRDDSVELVDIMDRVDRSLTVLGVLCEVAFRVKVDRDGTSQLERVRFVLGEVVTDTTLFTVHVGTTEFFVGNYFAGSSLDKGWSTEEHSCSALYHDDFVGHGRYVGSTSGAATEYNGDLGNAFG